VIQVQKDDQDLYNKTFIAPLKMRRGEISGDYYDYDIYDIKVADYDESNIQVDVNGTNESVKLINITR